MKRKWIFLPVVLGPLLHGGGRASGSESTEVDAGVPSRPRSFGEGMTRPSLLRGSSPLTYTADWLEKGKDGDLIVKSTLTREGRTIDCKLVNSVDYMNEETLKWLSQQRWTPVTFQGEPVEVRYVFQFAFRQGLAPQRGGGW
jgi:hypothetical protein